MGETAQTLTRAAAASLKAAGVATAPLDARLMMRHVLGLGSEAIMADLARRLSPEEEKRFSALVRRRTGREPLSHILGTREFWSLPFAVSPAVLDPRPDSETLVEAVLDHVRLAQAEDGHDLSILDLGTGSGCLLLALLHEMPNATGLGVDISNAALTVARANAASLGLETRVRFVESDWATAVDGRFDIVISNPPYIRRADIAGLAPEILDHEPRLALDGGLDGLDAYHRVIPGLQALFRPESRVRLAAFEVGQGQAEVVAALLSNNSFAAVAIHRDLAGIARCVTGSVV